MRLSDFQYDLPKRLIAQNPAERRTDSRLMVVDRSRGEIIHDHFVNLKSYLRAGDCLVLNDTRVMPARLFGRKAVRGTAKGTANDKASEIAGVAAAVAAGALVEVLLIREINDGEQPGREPLPVWEAIVRPGKRLQKSAVITFGADDAGGKGLCADDAGVTGMAHCIAGSGGLCADVVEVLPSGHRLLRFNKRGPELTELIYKLGKIPLPPYIKNSEADPERYQTVYSKHTGSAAAPTAGLHFTEQYLNEIMASGVDLAYLTLHIGPGTFAPVKTENIAEHHMHSEFYHVDDKAASVINGVKKARASYFESHENGGEHGEPLPPRVICVGTTSLRTLESVTSKIFAGENDASENIARKIIASKNDASENIARKIIASKNDASENIARENGFVMPCEGWTDIFIYPGYRFKCADALLTNFHLPGSTLIMLICAFAGYELAMEAYRRAVEEEYRFYSFGDAMLII